MGFLGTTALSLNLGNKASGLRRNGVAAGVEKVQEGSFPMQHD